MGIANFDPGIFLIPIMRINKKEFKMIKIKLINENKIINEISKEAYKQITPYMRIVMTDNEKLEWRKYDQKPGPKPNGLWYGMGTSWINWVKMEMPEWEKKNAYELKILQRFFDTGLILRITDYDQLVAFQEEYKADHMMNKITDQTYMIDWPRVKNNYAGIEIAPYIGEAGMDMMWYYGWDVASGCIWRTDIIDEMIPLGGPTSPPNKKI